MVHRQAGDEAVGSHGVTSWSTGRENNRLPDIIALGQYTTRPDACTTLRPGAAHSRYAEMRHELTVAANPESRSAAGHSTCRRRSVHISAHRVRTRACTSTSATMNIELLVARPPSTTHDFIRDRYANTTRTTDSRRSGIARSRSSDAASKAMCVAKESRGGSGVGRFISDTSIRVTFRSCRARAMSDVTCAAATQAMSSVTPRTRNR
jgi:hypothetical protein